jgi:uncharacterized protein (DUF433 family)
MSKGKDSDVFIHAKIIVRSDRRCPMTITDRIEMNPKVMMGKPVIRGTRLTVELILRKLSEGATERHLLDAYPKLTREDIHAAIRYAADALAHEETIILSSPRRAARR